MTSNNITTISQDEAKQLLSTCKRSSMRCRDTGATEVIWELDGSDLAFNDRFVASGWFDGQTLSISSASGADRLGVCFSFEGYDAEELKYCAASRVNITLQPSEAEQERASLERLAKAADKNGWGFDPATGGGLIIMPASD
jgi:hypothetical protein